jgi:hypothetical protein
VGQKAIPRPSADYFVDGRRQKRIALVERYIAKYKPVCTRDRQDKDFFAFSCGQFYGKCIWNVCEEALMSAAIKKAVDN